MASYLYFKTVGSVSVAINPIQVCEVVIEPATSLVQVRMSNGSMHLVVGDLNVICKDLNKALQKDGPLDTSRM